MGNKAMDLDLGDISAMRFEESELRYVSRHFSYVGKVHALLAG